MSLNENQLCRIRIQGFKSFKRCETSLGKINVLIGSNGAGKSNFISAFSFLQSVLSKNLQLTAAQSGVNTLFYKGRKETEEIAFEIQFGSNAYGFILLPTDDNRLVFQKEYFSSVGKSVWENRLAVGNRESMWESAAREPEYESIICTLRQQNWRVYHFHDTGRGAKVKQEHNISNNQALMFDASNLAAFLYRLKRHYRKDYEEIVRTTQMIAPFFYDFVLEPQEENPELIVLKWRQKGCEDVFNASQLSDGTLRFICLAVLLLQPRELRPAVLIMDEPELGLHPYAIMMFSELVKQLSEETQVIISTQSAELLNHFDAEDVIVAEYCENGTKFQRLLESELELWLQEDYTLGELWNMNILGGRLSK